MYSLRTIFERTYTILNKFAHPASLAPEQSMLAKADRSTVARRLMIDMFRRRALEQAYLETLAAHPELLDISTETRLLIIETLVENDRLLDGLGGRTREIFLMAQLDGLSYVEIGRQLKVSVNTVKKHAARALMQCLLSVED
jgi:RNA polymerase sigma-70 factor (ECF subfamily)